MGVNKPHVVVAVSGRKSPSTAPGLARIQDFDLPLSFDLTKPLQDELTNGMGHQQRGWLEVNNLTGLSADHLLESGSEVKRNSGYRSAFRERSHNEQEQ